MANILIIDDSRLVRNSFKRQLELDDHHCTIASDGSEALQIIIGNSFDLIITDIIMRHVDGIETIRAVRAIDKNIPIIAITGGQEAEQEAGEKRPTDSLKLALSMGATMTLRKPFSFEQLSKLVQICLGTDGDNRASIGL
jgi:CheY-like chemotaxis protein